MGEVYKGFFFQAEDGIRDFCLSRGLGTMNRDYRTGCFVSVHEDPSCSMIRAREGSWVGQWVNNPKCRGRGVR